VKKKTLLLRLVGALFFFTWFALNVSDATLLVYGVAFVPPYLTLMAQQYLASSPKRIRGYP
jgi:hypothetical protein